ncbi:MAG: putative DNA binding domain-containing protein [Blautia sp.]|nr:putative DNA binding domain-containing protein [Blautia sp.]
MTIEEILANEEMQIFDRKSINIEPRALAIPIVAFANADGGTVAIGISDKTRRIEGIDYEIQKLNELLRVPFDFCVPTVKAEIEKVPCIDFKGRNNHALLMHIEPSMEVHANQADEVFMRVGDKSKKLTFDERTQLMYDKGERFFEDKPVSDADLDDIDMEFVEKYVDKIGYSKSAMEYLKENKGFVKEKNNQIQISTAAISYLDTQIKEKTYLGEDGIFVTEEEYPKFVRQELIVNAVTHRDYSIRGTDIQIKMFDDRIVVESPGKLPGLVKIDNIRHTHFSRNPKIAEFLKTYNFVKEYGEGVDRMCKELETAGLQDPEYRINVFLLQTTIRNSSLLNQKALIDGKKHCLESEKPLIDDENHCLEGEEYKKLLFQRVEKAMIEKSITPIFAKNINEVIKIFEMDQIWGRKEIREELSYGDSKAGKTIEVMQLLDVIDSVKGKGKGKYVLKKFIE